jgi:hypothetical protein
MHSLVAKRQEVGPWQHPRGSAAVILGQYGRSTQAEQHCKYEGLSDISHFHQIFRKNWSGSPKFKIPRSAAFLPSLLVTESRQRLAQPLESGEHRHASEHVH